MYYRDYHPPHFHAIYAEHEALVQEWAGIHRAELEANWARAEAHLPLDTIAPLP